MRGDEIALEYVLESCQLRHRLRLRLLQHFMCGALSHHASGLQNDHALAKGKNFLALMGHIKDRNSLPLVPLADHR